MAFAKAFASHINLVISYIPVSLYAFLYGLPCFQPLAMATATDCFVLNILIVPYTFVISLYEQFENKFTLAGKPGSSIKPFYHVYQSCNYVFTSFFPGSFSHLDLT